MAPQPLKFIVFLLILILFFCASQAKRSKSTRAKMTSADESPLFVRLQSPSASSTISKHKKAESTDRLSRKAVKYDENTIEDVDEDKIDEILRDATKNLVIFFYDGHAKCPECVNALLEIEEIDDEIEATGYIEVVKTDDRSVARELGIATFPSLVYFRRKNPITYDGNFKDSEVILRWIRSHDEVVTWELTDDNFEQFTESYKPDEGSLDWFVMFYVAGDSGCNAFVSSWETVAHKLRGLVHVGKVDMRVNDDVTDRFQLDDDQCPTFLLFHRGKMYRYKDAAKDIRSLTAFGLHKFKEQRGHRVPEPPTALEHFYEHVKERVADILNDSQALTVIGIGGLIAIVITTLFANSRRKQQISGADKQKSN